MWSSPLDVAEDDGGAAFTRSRVDETLERSLAQSGAYDGRRRATAYTVGCFDGSARSSSSTVASTLVVVTTGSETGWEVCGASAAATRARVVGSVACGDGDATTSGFTGVGSRNEKLRDDDVSGSPLTTIRAASGDGKGGENSKTFAFASATGGPTATSARAWAEATLGACGCDASTKVLILTACAEHDTTEAEIRRRVIEKPCAYALETTATRVARSDWPKSPRALPLGVLIPSAGASALLSACEMRGIAARLIAIPESEPVRVMFGGADPAAAEEARAQCAEFLGVSLACEFKTRLSPMRAENVYA